MTKIWIVSSFHLQQKLLISKQETPEEVKGRGNRSEQIAMLIWHLLMEKKRELGRKNLRWQHSTEEVSAMLRQSPEHRYVRGELCCPALVHCMISHWLGIHFGLARTLQRIQRCSSWRLLVRCTPHSGSLEGRSEWHNAMATKMPNFVWEGILSLI